GRRGRGGGGGRAGEWGGPGVRARVRGPHMGPLPPAGPLSPAAAHASHQAAESGRYGCCAQRGSPCCSVSMMVWLTPSEPQACSGLSQTKSNLAAAPWQPWQETWLRAFTISDLPQCRFVVPSFVGGNVQNIHPSASGLNRLPTFTVASKGKSCRIVPIG